MIYKRLLTLLSAVLVIIFCVAAFLTTYTEVKEKSIRDLNIRLKIHASQAAKGIQNQIQYLIHILNFLANEEPVIRADGRGVSMMSNFYSSYVRDIKGITRVSALGRIVYTFPYKPESIGADISRQEHVREILATHKPVISDVFTAVQGFQSVAIHVPVFSGGRFDGTIAFLISFDELAQKYLGDISAGPNGRVWMVSRKGVLLFGPDVSQIGKSVFEVFGGVSGLTAMSARMTNGEENAAAFELKTSNGASVMHAIYTPVRIDNTFWSIAIAASEKDVLADMDGFRIRLVIIIALLFLCCTVVGILIIQHLIMVRENRKRKVMEEALRASDALYRQLFENNPAPMLVYESGSFQLLAVNEAFEHHYGYSREEALTLRLQDLYPESEKAGITDLASRLKGHAYAGEWHHVKKDGTVIDIMTHSHDIVYAGSPGRIAVITDITDRKCAETELRELNATLEQRVAKRTRALKVAMEEAQSADRLKTAFLSSMSHELRTPLNSIIGFTGIILQQLPGPLNDEQSRQLTMVQNSARHLLTLINDVLDISKIEAGQLEIFLEVFDMRPVIEEVLRIVMPMASKKGLSLVSVIDSGVGQVKSDRRRVSQILINLTNNAVKFTDRGEIRIECRIVEDGRVVEDGGITPGRALETSVRDTGIGIKEEDLGILFSPFSQVDTGLARQHEGTGLGLSICKKLVGMLGGNIRVESEWGNGSVFTFTLPC